MVVPVSPKFDDYALTVSTYYLIHAYLSVELIGQVQKKLWDAGFQVESDLAAGDTMNKKIRNAQLNQFNFILGKQTGLVTSM